MLIRFPYDGDEVEIEFPDNTAVLEGVQLEPLTDRAIRNEIENKYEGYRDVFDGKRVLVIVNDATRRIPTEKILRIILDLIPLNRLEILIATGTHRAPSENELNSIFGDLKTAVGRRILIHDCHDEELMRELGHTSRGTPVIVNKRLAEAEAVICVNSVEPHFFAGYTGGRKSLVPGLASFKTIVANHSHAKFEEAKSLNLDSNPVHLDLEEAADFLSDIPIFSIQLVLSLFGEIVGLYCGSLKESFNLACEKSMQVYSVTPDKAYDIVFAIGEPPLDSDLYQLQKAQEHGGEAVADGGILVVVGACHEGIGSRYFMDLADEYPEPRSALMEKAMQDNRFGIHKLIKTARRLEKIKIWYVTKLDDITIRKVYFNPKNSPQQALNEALEYFGGSGSVAVLRDACYLVPIGFNVRGGS